VTEDLNGLISQAQAELDFLKCQMEVVRKQFAQDTVKFVREWYEKTAREYVDREADITLSLGKEKLAQMKSKVSKLIEDTETIVNQFLSDRKLWWHLVEDNELFYLSSSPRVHPSFLDKNIRLALGKLGVTLEEFGYVKTKSPTLTEVGIWCEYPNGRPYYPYGIDWPETMQNTINKYSELCEKAKGKRGEIDCSIARKNEHHARNLWDSI